MSREQRSYKRQTVEHEQFNSIQLPNIMVKKILSYLPSMQMMLWAYGVKLLSNPSRWESNYLCAIGQSRPRNAYQHMVRYNYLVFSGTNLLSMMLSTQTLHALCQSIEEWAQDALNQYSHYTVEKERIKGSTLRSLERKTFLLKTIPKSVLIPMLEQLFDEDELGLAGTSLKASSSTMTMTKMRECCDYILAHTYNHDALDDLSDQRLDDLKHLVGAIKGTLLKLQTTKLSRDMVSEYYRALKTCFKFDCASLGGAIPPGYRSNYNRTYGHPLVKSTCKAKLFKEWVSHFRVEQSVGPQPGAHVSRILDL